MSSLYTCHLRLVNSYRLRLPSRIVSQTQPQLAVVPVRNNSWTVSTSPPHRCRRQDCGAGLGARSSITGTLPLPPTGICARAGRPAVPTHRASLAEALNATADNCFPQAEQVFLTIISSVTVSRLRVRSPTRAAEHAMTLYTTAMRLRSNVGSRTFDRLAPSCKSIGLVLRSDRPRGVGPTRTTICLSDPRGTRINASYLEMVAAGDVAPCRPGKPINSGNGRTCRGLPSGRGCRRPAPASARSARRSAS